MHMSTLHILHIERYPAEPFGFSSVEKRLGNSASVTLYFGGSIRHTAPRPYVQLVPIGPGTEARAPASP
jgi:hypothetical protein